jgi:hypothetical protein
MTTMASVCGIGECWRVALREGRKDERATVGRGGEN